MDQEQVEKFTIQCFRGPANHTCVFSMVSVWGCKCEYMPFQSRPDFVFEMSFS